MSFLHRPPGEGVYARCPRCSVCADLGAETNSDGRIFCSNCGRRSAMTEWYPCGIRGVGDSSSAGRTPFIANTHPARLPVEPLRAAQLAARASSAPSISVGSFHIPMGLIAVGVIGVLAGILLSRRHHATANTSGLRPAALPADPGVFGSGPTRYPYRP